MQIYLSLLVALIAAIMFLTVTHAKWARIGEIMFSCGLLAFLLRVADANFGIIAR